MKFFLNLLMYIFFIRDSKHFRWQDLLVEMVKLKWVYFLALMCFLPTGHCLFSDWYNAVLHKLDVEVCDDYFISPDFVKLRMNLNELLFGQDIIINKVVPALESHFKFQPKKALVICMHGWTGSGKNYATKIIIDSIFRKNVDSEFVKMFNGRLHFPLDVKEYVDQYKIDLQRWVRGNVTKCPRSLFVFDEVDKMPAGVIDAIKPYFDYHEKIDSVDYRKAIFIFISNLGGQVINSQYMDLWRRGVSRVDMEYKHFEPYLRNALYKLKGGFKDSAVLEGHLVSLYLPFLPLEVEQVRKCIRAEFHRQGVEPVGDEYVDAVLDEMEFNSDSFSMSGCKRVPDLVASVKYKKRHEEL